MKLVAFAILVGFFASTAQAAEDCTLKQLASLPISVLPDGDMAVPVTIAGTERKFKIGIDAPFSAILGKFADEKGSKSLSMPFGIKPVVEDQKVTLQVKVPDIRVGSLHGTDFAMLRYENNTTGDSDAVGVLGLDFLANADLELDLRNNKLNLFSQDHCEGQVVYWAKAYAAVPFTKDESGHFAAEMQLDGKPVTVDLDAAMGDARMGAATVKRIFGLDEQSPDFKRVTTPPGWQPQYSYPFKSLSIDGIAIGNPKITIESAIGDCRPKTQYKGSGPYRCYGMADVRLRSTELRALHLFIAFKEKMLYVTAADAKLPAVEPVK